MKAAFVADVHLANFTWQGGEMEAGINARARDVLHVLARALEAAQAAEAEEFVVLGDLFDAANPTPQLVAAVAKLFRDATVPTRYGKKRMRVVILKGNHDSVSDTAGDNALAPLRYVCDEVTVVDVPTRISVDAPGLVEVLPFAAGPSATWLPEAWAHAVDPKITRVVGLHLGISHPARTPHFLLGAADSVDVGELVRLSRETRVRTVVAGNWHNHLSWDAEDVDGRKLTVVQCGTLCPADFSDAEPMDKPNYGGLIIVDTAKASWERVEIPGPRFEVISWDDEAAAWAKKLARYAKRHGHKLYVQARAAPAKLREARAALAATPGLAGFRVLPDTARLQAVAQEAAAATRGTQNLVDATREFCSKMALTEDVDRNELTAEVLRFLGGKA